MNLLDLLEDSQKAVATKSFFKDKGAVTVMRIKKDAVLKDHQSMSKALLIILSGKAIYEDTGRKENLANPMDFVRIPEKVTHKVIGVEDAVLLLIH